MYQAGINICLENIDINVLFMAEKVHTFLTNLIKEQLKFLAKLYESRREFSIIFYDVKPKNVCLNIFLQII